jgi:hypothetical protein
MNRSSTSIKTVWHRIAQSAQLENILGTEYQRIGILGEIFNYGTVYITVGGTQLAFEDVIDPASVQSDINRRRLAQAARKKGISGCCRTRAHG